MLSKLIKKHDEKLDGKHDENTEVGDEVDVSSPATIKSTIEDIQSDELITPIVGTQAEELPGSESFHAKNSERASVYSPLPDRWPRHNAEDEVIL